MTLHLFWLQSDWLFGSDILLCIVVRNSQYQSDSLYRTAPSEFPQGLV